MSKRFLEHAHTELDKGHRLQASERKTSPHCDGMPYAIMGHPAKANETDKGICSALRGSPGNPVQYEQSFCFWIAASDLEDFTQIPRSLNSYR